MKKRKLVEHIEDLIDAIEIDKSTIDHLMTDRNNLALRVDELTKEARLKAKGWRTGSAEDFLGSSNDEMNTGMEYEDILMRNQQLAAKVEQLETEMVRANQHTDEQFRTIQSLKGTIKADDERLTTAGDRVGMGQWDCEIPEMMADKIEQLVKELDEERQLLNSMVDFILDKKIESIPDYSITGIPVHMAIGTSPRTPCKGGCRFCVDWVTANMKIYGDSGW